MDDPKYGLVRYAHEAVRSLRRLPDVRIAQYEPEPLQRFHLAAAAMAARYQFSRGTIVWTYLRARSEVRTLVREVLP